jgi:hypothetical protein
MLFFLVVSLNIETIPKATPAVDFLSFIAMVARFFLVQTHIPQRGKIYQMNTNYTKRPQNIPNGHKIFQMDM